MILHGPAYVTVAIMSCGRPDLLYRTWNSFKEYNTHPILDTILNDDCGDDLYQVGIHRRLGREMTLVFPRTQQGAAYCFDNLVRMCHTEYVFFTEDDWEYHSSGFIEKSLAIMEADKSVHNVWIRDHDDLPHPLLEKKVIGGVECHDIEPRWQGIWGGWSTNPGLRRLSDIHRFFPEGTAAFHQHPTREINISRHLMQTDYRVVALHQAAARHIGYDKRVSNYTE